MKIEKITNNKIRIILNLDDLKSKNIDLHSFMSNSIESQSLFIDMLDEAERTVGFYVKDSKVLIEAIASSEGLFVFTITKVEDDIPKKKTIRIKRKNISTNFTKTIYKFDSFDEFCNFCTYIKNSNLGNLKDFAKKILLYEYNYKYFLVFSDINKDFKNTSLVYVAICEFASLASTSPCFYSKLIEYGKSIFKNNAIQNGINFSESNINK